MGRSIAHECCSSCFRFLRRRPAGQPNVLGACFARPRRATHSESERRASFGLWSGSGSFGNSVISVILSSSRVSVSIWSGASVGQITFFRRRRASSNSYMSSSVHTTNSGKSEICTSATTSPPTTPKPRASRLTGTCLNGRRLRARLRSGRCVLLLIVIAILFVIVLLPPTDQGED